MLSAAERQNRAIIAFMRKWRKSTINLEKPNLVSEESYIEWYDDADDESTVAEEIRIEGQEK